MADFFVLVHAPVLGPSSWAPVSDQLARLGHQVTVPSLAGFTDDGSPCALRLVQRVRAQVPNIDPADRAVLVVHSGAGVFAPHLAKAINARNVAVVFADAALPTVSGNDRVVDSTFMPFLRATASGGMVPPWHQWWPAEDLSPLFPDEATRRSVTDEARSLPLAFFEESLPPVPDSWRSCPSGYLRFSEGYLQQALEARRRGWPIRELRGEHLHMLVDPAGVAATIITLGRAAAAQAR